MTFISRYSAETLKNITFFEKFGKKKREIFFTFFSVFSGFFREIFHPIFGRVHVVSKRFPEIDPEISGNSRGVQISGNFGKICPNLPKSGVFRQKILLPTSRYSRETPKWPPGNFGFFKNPKKWHFSIFFDIFRKFWKNFKKFSKTLLVTQGTKFPENFTFFFFVIFRDFRKLKIYNVYKSLQRENIEKTSKFWRFFFEKFSEIFRFFSEFSEKFS